jgi:hypothetical protein
MKSIFDLIDTTSELSSTNQGLARLEYDEIQPLRTITDAGAQKKFSDGLITLRWNYSNSKWYLPARSYIKMIIDLKQGTGGADNDPLLLQDEIAPSMGLSHNLFSQMTYTIADKNICQITNNYPQIASHNMRLEKPREWFKSTGANSNFWQTDFSERQNAVSADGTNKELIHSNEVNGKDVLTRAQTFDGALIDEANDTLALGANNGVFSWVDNAGADLDLRNAANLAVGDMILYRNTNQSYYSIHRITAIAQLDLTVSPAPSLAAIGANVANNANFDLRVVKNTSKFLARRVRTFEVYFQPALSIYQISHGIPGGGKHELQLLPYPRTILENCAIESVVAKTTDVDFRFEVKDMRLYNAVCDGPVLEKKQFMLDLSETRAQLLEITSAEPTQYSVDISPSANRISLAVQDNRVLSSTLYSPTKFVAGDHLQNGISKSYLRFAGLQLPNPDYDVEFNNTQALANGVAGRTDKLTELYFRNIMYNGGYYDSSQETFHEWRDRGLFMSFPIARTATSRETRAYIKMGFENLSAADKALLIANSKIIVFDTFKKVAIIKMEAGKVYEVLLNDV